MSEGVFVTGTDTGVGKTVFACALLKSYAAAGWRAVGMKPVAAGGGYGNGDLAALAAAGNVDAPLSARCPYAFDDAIAPHLAAQSAGAVIELDRIVECYRTLSEGADRVVVEGAGGALAPIGHRLDMLDIAAALGLSVCLVVGVRLGCLNHALLTCMAIQSRGLRLGGWVANCIDPVMERRDDNIETLERRLPAPRVARIEFGYADAPQWSAESVRLNFSRRVDPC
jgi:dethiobiotin synthetase